MSLDLSNNSDLIELSCYSNQLTSLDLSKNPSLIWFSCYSNKLISLELNDKPSLTWLYCWNNHLTSLDVSDAPALTNLQCYTNQLISLDVSKNPSLIKLNCYWNELAILNVSNNPALTGLNCSKNQLTSLDVSEATALTGLDCSNNKLKSLDVRNNYVLSGLNCSKNQLTSLDLKNGNNHIIYSFFATDNPNLYCIEVDDSAWSASSSGWHKDPQAHYSENCGYTAVEEYTSRYVTVLSISPNPANGYIEIALDNHILQGMVGNTRGAEQVLKDVVKRVKIYDVLGVEHHVSFAVTPLSDGNLRLDVSGLTVGVYFVRMGGRMLKFVKM